jgi:hypothetical protein
MEETISEDLGVNASIKLEWILNKQVVNTVRNFHVS